MRDSDVPTTAHSGPLNLPKLGRSTWTTECCSAVLTGTLVASLPSHQAEKTSTQTNALPTTYFGTVLLSTHHYSRILIPNMFTTLREITGQHSHLFAFACTFGPNNFSTHKNNDDATRPPPKAQGADEQREEETERSRRIYLSPALPSSSSETAACSRADSSDPHSMTWRRVPDRDEKIVMVPPADGCLARSARDT